MYKLCCHQGRLEPVETFVKNNKRGVGAERVKKKVIKHSESGTSTRIADKVTCGSTTIRIGPAKGDSNTELFKISLTLLHC